MTIRLFGAASALCVLAACGGSSSIPNPLSFSEIETLSEDLYTANVNSILDSDYSNLSDLPTSGSAKHVGVMGIGYGAPGVSISDPTLVGEISTDIDFRTSELTGTAQNFYLVGDGSQLSGRLDIDAELDRDVNLTFDFGISGNITGQLNNENVTVDHDIPFLADAYGDDGEILFGISTGTSTDQTGSVFDTEASYILEEVGP